MSFKGKLFLVLMAAAAAIYLFGPNAAQMEVAQQEAETASQQTEEPRVEHYAGEVANNATEARNLLQKKTAEINTILGKQALNDSDLESIHEHSYSLEHAVDRLRADHAAAEEKIDNLDEAVQALHYASENHNEAETRQWFGKMQNAIQSL